MPRNRIDRRWFAALVLSAGAIVARPVGPHGACWAQGSATAVSQPPQTQAPAAPAAVPTIIPFELSGNKVYLQVTINSKGPYWFALDTGAPMTVIDTALARSLGLRLSQRGAVGGAGEAQMRAYLARGASIRMGDFALTSGDVLAIPIEKHLSAYDGRKLQGLVGNDSFGGRVVEIDYQEREVRIHDAETFRYAGDGAVIPVEHRGYTFLSVGVTPRGGEPIAARFIIDTGARLGVGLSAPFVREHHLIDPSEPLPVMTVGYGVGGPVRHAVGRLERLSIGPVTIEDPVATFSQERRGVFAGDLFDGVVGAEILRRFNVILDYPRGRIILEKNDSFDEPIEFDMSGLWYAFEGEAFDTLRVKSVAPGSPADEAGVKEGDVIVTIDGRPAAAYTPDQLRDLLRRENKTVTLELRRGDETINTRLILRRQV